MRGRIEEFRALDAEPYAINPGDALTEAALWSSLQLPFDVLVDRDSAVAASYGAVRQTDGRVERLVVVVGRDGRVLHRRAGKAAPGELLEVLLRSNDEATMTLA